MEGFDLMLIAEEDDDEDNVTDNSKNSNDEEKNTFNIKLKVICQGAHWHLEYRIAEKDKRKLYSYAVFLLLPLCVTVSPLDPIIQLSWAYI